MISELGFPLKAKPGQRLFEMCANCGFPETLGYWSDAGSTTANDRIRSRIIRAKKINDILINYNLRFSDDGTSQYCQVSNLLGEVKVITQIDEVWEAAASLYGRPIDPLEKNFFA